MIEHRDSNSDKVLRDATELVLAIDEVAMEIDVPELKNVTTIIVRQKRKILQRQFNNKEKS